MLARSTIIACASLVGCSSSPKPPTPTSTDPTPAVTLVQIAAGEGALAPNLAQGKADSVLVTWLEPAGDGHRLQLARIQGGKSSEPRTVIQSDELVANWADVPAVHEHGDRLVVTWLQSTGKDHAYDAFAAESTDGGQTFRPLGRLHDDGTQTEHGFVSLTWAEGEHWATWLDGRQTAQSGPMTLRAARLGARPPASQVVDDKVCDCCPTAMVTTSAGPLIAYRDRSDQEVRDISVVHFDGNAWSAPRQVHADNWVIEGCPVNGPAAAARGDTVAVAWYTQAGDQPRVLVAQSTDAGRTFAQPVELSADQPGRALGRVQVALDPAGEILVAWLQANSERDGAQLVVRRTDGEGGLGPVRHVADVAPNRQSGVPRMLITDSHVDLAWTTPDRGKGGTVQLARLELREVAAVGPSEPKPGPQSGEAADPTELQVIATNGTRVALADLRGQAVLVNLWATWCAPCREEMPHLIDIHTAYRDRGLEVIGLSVDDADLQPQVEKMAAELGVTFPIWLDPDQRLQTALDAPSLPVTIILDRKGNIVFRRDGTITADDPELTSAIERALTQPPP